MAIVIGSRNGEITGVIGDTDKGFDLQAYIRRKLAEQCYFQHLEQDASFRGGQIKSYWMGDITEDMDPEEDAEFYMEYANGEVWEYRRIAYGSEGMIKRKIN